MLPSLWDLSSLTRDWTWAHSSKNPKHWTTRELPQTLLFKSKSTFTIYSLYNQIFPLCNIFRHIISSFMTVKWHFIVLTICAINYLTNPGNFGHLDCFQFLCIRNNVAANFLSHRSPALGLVAYDKFLQVAGGGWKNRGLKILWYSSHQVLPREIWKKLWSFDHWSTARMMICDFWGQIIKIPAASTSDFRKAPSQVSPIWNTAKSHGEATIILAEPNFCVILA